LKTVIRAADCSEPSAIRAAAEVLRAGGLVAFPTETVYGLGASALSAEAVARVFEAKGRPATNPVIVHVARAADVLNVAAEWPATAAALAERFWPGPLTLVVPKGLAVPEIVTAGGSTVAVRCPNHAVARALIEAAGVPVAAPSANRSTELSPTRAEHVLKSLNGRIDFLLDGGPCSGGIESTVVDVTGDVPRVLRPGLISAPQLAEVVGRVEVGASAGGVARSPGQMARHYSPRTPLLLAVCLKEAYRLRAVAEREGRRAAIVAMPVPMQHIPYYRTMPEDPEAYAAELYATLHELDAEGWDRIVIELPPDAPEWAGVRDRLLRAAAANASGNPVLVNPGLAPTG
jgi:L-threonylcarbamoyladenylate synthase